MCKVCFGPDVGLMLIKQYLTISMNVYIKKKDAIINELFIDKEISSLKNFFLYDHRLVE